MKGLKITSDQRVDEIFNSYPDPIREKMLFLRKLVMETAEETEGISFLEETLKWGEPSYVTKKGSTLRMDWKPRHPNQYALYFQCSSRLISTFRIVFDGVLWFEGNRAILFDKDQKIPVVEVKECIKAALTYREVKHLMTLGI